MGVQSLQIIFDNPTAIFMPGQSVTGRVLVIVDGSVKIRGMRNIFLDYNRNNIFVCVLGIKLKFKGEAKNSWTEQESRRDDSGETQNYSVKYDAEEEYFENKSTLVGGGGELKLLLLLVILI